MDNKYFRRTWAVIELTEDRYNIEATTIAVETALVEGQSGLVIGGCKALIESFCKSILREKNISFSPDLDVGPLAKLAIGALGVGNGVDNERKAREAFMKLVSSFTNTLTVATQVIGELRNEFCPISHGKSADHKSLDIHYAEFVASQSDALVGFVYQLRMSREVLAPTDPPLRDGGFDSFLDDQFGERTIFEDVYFASEVLFNVNPSRYRDALADYKASLSGTSNT